MGLFRALKIALLLFFIAIPLLSFHSGFAYQNEPDGFREFRWQTDIKQIKNLQLVQEYGGLAEYTRDNENLDFEGVRFDRILYGFTGSRLETVILELETLDDIRYNLLRALLLSKFGTGEADEAKGIFWRGEKTNIKLSRYGREIICFSDSATFSQRLRRIDDFLGRFDKQMSELLKDNSAYTAAAKLKEWLAAEGKGMLDSYYVSPDGQKITLNFRGAGAYLISPHPANAEKEMESQKPYGVAEALKILNTSPERFKGKDIFLKAYVVDGVMGLGCDDYYVLTDAEYAENYAKRYNQGGLTEYEKEIIKNTPILFSGPTLSMPKEIFPTRYAIYRGHFFDSNLTPCQNGARRFVIIGKDKELP
ncbi:MAG: hypothetical protein ACM3IL_02310 [Deltaproteobacteria bacterium]